MQLGTILMLGFVLGMRHATDADHVVAVGTLVRREAGLRGALTLGALWGVGHTLTVVAVGVAIIVCGVAVPSGGLQAMELAVGVMLVGLGVVGMRPASHAHVAPARRVRPLLVGIVHGLAGSAGIALLALTTIADKTRALGYLLLFGAGTIAGMMLITIAMVTPFLLASQRFERFFAIAMRGASFASIVLGLVVGGRVLFGGH